MPEKGVSASYVERRLALRRKLSVDCLDGTLLSRRDGPRYILVLLVFPLGL